MSIDRYTEINETWTRYERHEWVIDTKSGRIGRIYNRRGRLYVVQYGSGGPFDDVHHDNLLLATKTQVLRAEGVIE